MITQRTWRRVGAVTIGAGGVMAVYAVATDLLRDTILHALGLFGARPEGSELTPGLPGWAVALYWLVFFGLIGAALYCALLDLRYIRMQYAVGKREIFSRTLGDEKFRDSLLKGPKDES